MASSEVEELRRRLREMQRELREANRELLDRDEQLLEACAREAAAIEQAAQAEEENAWLTEIYHLIMEEGSYAAGSAQDVLQQRNQQLVQTSIVIAKLKAELQKLRDKNRASEAKYNKFDKLRERVEEKAQKLQKEMTDLTMAMSRLNYDSASTSSRSATDH
ncbi:uncharacterized protein EI97DRAFT_456043 [Westerdykella ornata]|uniref:Uncharacterized protein n=1 Tax=Westerdykella ornata TaxID=318751 RepID=A0A6A6JS73_WESOR|nr:uncharacterized protein EI97DRAFT_456043 [Westerdykella ornata]KAF2278576.1 hypothetical protein EI97DRAFT_456043 [Westerdykella ornata]